MYAGALRERPLEGADVADFGAGGEDAPEDEAPLPPRRREGLPPSYRMRHQRHYVEQLIGDGPLRTVREIAIADIEAPAESDANIKGLEESIRRVGVLEPLLVCEQDGRYHVITGVNRLRAARNVGLRSVPCLVYEVDEDMVRAMREAVSQGAVEPRFEPAVADEPPAEEQPLAAEAAHALPPAFAEVTSSLQFVSSLMPAIAAAGHDRFRRTILSDLASTELLRARMVAAAAGALAGSLTLARQDTDCGELVGRVIDAVGVETRLRGVRLDVSLPMQSRVSLDPALTDTALTGLLLGVLGMLEPGASLGVHAEVTCVRPAFILRLEQSATGLTPDELRRFFDAGWEEHRAGSAGALLLAAAVRVARLHGGRADVQPTGNEGSGWRLTFVIPHPIAA